MIDYCVEWSLNRERSWSGTTKSLFDALCKKADVRDCNLRLSSSYIACAVMNILDIPDFYIRRVKKQSSRYWKQSQHGNVIFKFSEAPFPKGGERHYSYQDMPLRFVDELASSGSPLFNISGFSQFPKAAIHRRALQHDDMYRHCSGIFTMGAWMRNYMIEVMELPPEKVFHVGGGYNSFANCPEKRHGNKFLFIGRDFKRKGGDLVIEAFSILHSKHPDLSLTVAGSRNRNDIPGVTFLDDVDKEEVRELYATHDVFVMPSRYEPYGLVFQEARASGLPCIGMDRFEMPYFIEDHVTGALLRSESPHELAELMLEVIDSSDIRNEASRRAESFQNSVSWDAVADRILKVIYQGQQ